MTITTNMLRVSLFACSLLALGACSAPPGDDDFASESSAYREDAGHPSDTPPTKPSPPKAPPPPVTRPVVVAYPPIPPRVANVALWLDPEVNLQVDPFSDGIVSWRDRAGLSTIAVSSLELTTLGGRRAVASVDGAVTATLAKSLGQRPFCIFMVERIAERETMGWLVRMNDAPPTGGTSAFGIFVEPANQMTFAYTRNGAVVGNKYAQPDSADLQTHIVTLRRRDSNVALFLDDEPTYTSTGTTTYDAYGIGGREQMVFGQVWPLGGLWNTAGSYPGEVVFGDILVYDADLSDADVADAKNFLRGHYGL